MNRFTNQLMRFGALLLMLAFTSTVALAQTYYVAPLGVLGVAGGDACTQADPCPADEAVAAANIDAAASTIYFYTTPNTASQYTVDLDDPLGPPGSGIFDEVGGTDITFDTWDGTVGAVGVVTGFDATVIHNGFMVVDVGATLVLADNLTWQYNGNQTVTMRDDAAILGGLVRFATAAGQPSIFGELAFGAAASADNVTLTIQRLEVNKPGGTLQVTDGVNGDADKVTLFISDVAGGGGDAGYLSVASTLNAQDNEIVFEGTGDDTATAAVNEQTTAGSALQIADGSSITGSGRLSVSASEDVFTTSGTGSLNMLLTILGGNTINVTFDVISNGGESLVEGGTTATFENLASLIGSLTVTGASDATFEVNIDISGNLAAVGGSMITGEGTVDVGQELTIDGAGSVGSFEAALDVDGTTTVSTGGVLDLFKPSNLDDLVFDGDAELNLFELTAEGTTSIEDFTANAGTQEVNLAVDGAVAVAANERAHNLAITGDIAFSTPVFTQRLGSEVIFNGANDQEISLAGADVYIDIVIVDKDNGDDLEIDVASVGFFGVNDLLQVIGGDFRTNGMLDASGAIVIVTRRDGVRGQLLTGASPEVYGDGTDADATGNPDEVHYEGNEGIFTAGELPGDAAGGESLDAIVVNMDNDDAVVTLSKDIHIDVLLSVLRGKFDVGSAYAFLTNGMTIQVGEGLITRTGNPPFQGALVWPNVPFDADGDGVVDPGDLQVSVDGVNLEYVAGPGGFGPDATGLEWPTTADDVLVALGPPQVTTGGGNVILDVTVDIGAGNSLALAHPVVAAKAAEATGLTYQLNGDLNLTSGELDINGSDLAINAENDVNTEVNQLVAGDLADNHGGGTVRFWGEQETVVDAQTNADKTVVHWPDTEVNKDGDENGPDNVLGNGDDDPVRVRFFISDLDPASDDAFEFDSFTLTAANNTLAGVTLALPATDGNGSGVYVNGSVDFFRTTGNTFTQLSSWFQLDGANEFDVTGDFTKSGGLWTSENSLDLLAVSGNLIHSGGDVDTDVADAVAQQNIAIGGDFMQSGDATFDADQATEVVIGGMLDQTGDGSWFLFNSAETIAIAGDFNLWDGSGTMNGAVTDAVIQSENIQLGHSEDHDAEDGEAASHLAGPSNAQLILNGPNAIWTVGTPNDQGLGFISGGNVRTEMTTTEDDGFDNGDRNRLFLEGSRINFGGNLHHGAVGDRITGPNDMRGLEGTLGFRGDAQQSVWHSADPSSQLSNVDIQNSGGGILLMSDMTTNHWDADEGWVRFANGRVDTQNDAFRLEVLNPGFEFLHNPAFPFFGAANNAPDESPNIVRLGHSQSYVDGMVTRAMIEGTATGGQIDEGYVFPLGFNPWAPLIQQFGSFLGQVVYSSVEILQPDEVDASGFVATETETIIGSEGSGQTTITLDVLANRFYKVQYHDANGDASVPPEDPNIRIVGGGLASVTRDIAQVRMVQFDCQGNYLGVAGIYDLVFSDPDDNSAGLNDFVNGVPNFVQEGIEVPADGCFILGIATDSSINPGFGTAIDQLSTIAGMVTYGDTDTPVEGAEVSLTVDGTVVATTTTDADGNYSFDGVVAGTYDVEVTSATFTETGLTLTDALEIVRFFVGEIEFTAAQEAAADVNGDGQVNSTDALLVAQAAVDASIDLGTFSTVAVVTVPPSQTDVDLQVGATGDVNQSGGVSAAKQAGVLATVKVNVDGAIQAPAEEGAVIEVPFRLSSAMSLGAYTVDVSFPDELATFSGVTSTYDGLVSHVGDGVVRIGWFDATGKNPIALSSGETLFTVNFVTTSAAADGDSFIPEVSGEFANGTADILAGASLTLAEVGFGVVPTEFALNGNYPNPFNPSTMVSFDLPQEAEVHIELYNVMGQRVLTLPTESMSAGAAKQVRIDGSSLASGTYLYRVIARGSSKTFVETGRMTLIK